MPTQEPAAHGPASGSGVRGDTYEAAAATGESVAAPGESVAAPGKSVAAPGKSVAAPGKSVAAPGESVAAPGKSVVAPDGTAADAGQAAAAPGEIRAAPGSSADGPGGSPTRRLAGAAAAWASVFAVSLGLFTVRFLVPVPVGLADNHDGPRLMCGLGVGTGHRRPLAVLQVRLLQVPPRSGLCRREPLPLIAASVAGRRQVAHPGTRPARNRQPDRARAAYLRDRRLRHRQPDVWPAAAAVGPAAGGSRGVADHGGCRLLSYLRQPVQRGCHPGRIAAGRGGRGVPGTGMARPHVRPAAGRVRQRARDPVQGTVRNPGCADLPHHRAGECGPGLQARVRAGF